LLLVSQSRSHSLHSDSDTLDNMSSGKLTLYSNDFINNVCSNYKDLLSDSEFTDVTLACDEGNQIKAHRMILASSSSFFRNIFRKNPNLHTLVYLRGVDYKELVEILSFIYLGKIEIAQADMIKFMQTANFLKIKGLVCSGNEKDETNQEGDDQEFVNENVCKELASTTETEVLEESSRLHENNLILRRSLSFSIIEENEGNSVEKEDIKVILAPAINFSITGDEPVVAAEQTENESFEIKRRPIMFDNKRRHMYSCGQCTYENMNLSNVKIHIQTKHTDITAQCPNCEKKYSDPSSLKYHIKSVHKGIRHPCSFCEYKSRTRGALRYHVFNSHKKTE
jgi:hypothetical protein